jgi:hypothetical protein
MKFPNAYIIIILTIIFGSYNRMHKKKQKFSWFSFLYPRHVHNAYNLFISFISLSCFYNAMTARFLLPF